MLDGFTRHGLYDLTLRVHGDLNVDDHHTIEDTGIVLGNAIREAVGDKKGIKRYGSCILPMDEVLVLCAVDLSGRPYLGWDAAFSTEKIGDMATEMVKEFFYAVSYSCLLYTSGKVYINDSETPLDDSFVSETPLGSFGPYEVPENCYFMMGDNRNNSKDSRYWQNTYVQFDQIVGKAEIRYFPSIKLLN